MSLSSETRTKLFRVLLDRAVNLMSQQGCNDFSLRRDAGLTEDEAKSVIEAYNVWDQQNNPVGFEPNRPTEDILMDWSVLRFLQDEVAP